MIDYLKFIRFTERRGHMIPKEVEGLSLALLLRENPNKFFWRGDVCFVWCSVNQKFLWCNPFNKRIWWYEARGLEESYEHYVKLKMNHYESRLCEVPLAESIPEGVLPF